MELVARPRVLSLRLPALPELHSVEGPGLMADQNFDHD
jgi:hypothetical protein